MNELALPEEPLKSGGAFVAGVGLCLALYGLVEGVSLRRDWTRWPHAQAVASTRYTRTMSTGYRRRSSGRYVTSYRYNVEGAAFESRAERSSTIYGLLFAPRDGDQVTIAYNPADKGEVVERGTGPTMLVFGLGVGGLLLALGYRLFSGSRERAAAPALPAG